MVTSTSGVDGDAAGEHDLPCRPLPPVGIQAKAADPAASLKRLLADDGQRTLFVAETAGRREALLERSQHEVETSICRHLGLPEPEPPKKGLLDQLFGKA